MRQCGIDGKFHGKSGRLPLCYPDRIWYDESILREGSGKKIVDEDLKQQIGMKLLEEIPKFPLEEAKKQAAEE